jgi:hypothetical protein
MSAQRQPDPPSGGGQPCNCRPRRVELTISARPNRDLLEQPIRRPVASPGQFRPKPFGITTSSLPELDLLLDRQARVRADE